MVCINKSYQPRNDEICQRIKHKISIVYWIAHTKQGKWAVVYSCVGGSIWFLFTIRLLDFGTVPAVWYICVIYLCDISVWYICVICQCDISVWYICVIYQCDISVWYISVIYLCDMSVWYICVIYLFFFFIISPISNTWWEFERYHSKQKYILKVGLYFLINPSAEI